MVYIDSMRSMNLCIVYISNSYTMVTECHSHATSTGSTSISDFRQTVPKILAVVAGAATPSATIPILNMLASLRCLLVLGQARTVHSRQPCSRHVEGADQQGDEITHRPAVSNRLAPA